MKTTISFPAFITVPYILLYSIIFSLCLGQLTRISFFSQSVNGYLHEMFMAIFIMMSLFSYGVNPLRQLFKQRNIGVIFIGYLFLSLLLSFINYNHFENLVAFLYFFRLLFYGLFGLYLYTYIREKKISLTSIVTVGAVTTLVVSAIQHFAFPIFNPITTMGWDPHQYRMVGTFFDPPIAGAIYGLFGGFFYWQYIQKKELWTVFVSILFLICLILTYSRGAYLALGVTVLIYLMAQKRYFVIGILMSVFLLLFLFFSQSTNESLNLRRMTSIESRVDDYSEAVSLWREQPIVGIGYNHIGAEKMLKEGEIPKIRVSHAAASFHSSFLIILVTGGIIGLILFLLTLLKIASFNPFAQYSVIFLSIASLTDNVFLHPFILLLFPFLLLPNLFGKLR